MKKFYIEGYEENYVTYDDLTLISNIGIESSVYKYKELAFKVFKAYSNRLHLSKNDIEYMSKINTRRILLPKYAIREEESIGKIDGYAMEFISGNENILDTLIYDLLNELEYIETDIKVLSEYLVSIQDLTLKNYVYSNGLYLIDPGSYGVGKIDNLKICYDLVNIETLSEKEKQILIEVHNHEIFDEFTLSLLISSYLIEKGNLSYFQELAKYLRIKKHILKASNYLSVLEEENCNDMTVREYVKQIYSKVI